MPKLPLETTTEIVFAFRELLALADDLSKQCADGAISRAMLALGARHALRHGATEGEFMNEVAMWWGNAVARERKVDKKAAWACMGRDDAAGDA